MESVFELLKPLIELYSGQFGIIAQIVSFMGSFRLIFKPLMGVIDVVVKLTPSKSDDNLVQEIEESKIYKSIKFIVDWIASIKLPENKKK